MIGAFPTALKRTTTVHCGIEITIIIHNTSDDTDVWLPFEGSFFLYVSNACRASVTLSPPSGAAHGIERPWISGLPGDNAMHVCGIEQLLYGGSDHKWSHWAELGGVTSLFNGNGKR
jgi:hypothetical protein